MLSFFIRNKRGVITVMLSIVLIAALSLNSTLLEIARYRSLERLYKEIEENSAFSVLSQYDRELWENFGLLAIESDTGKDEFMGYLQANLNGLMSNTNGIDRLLSVSEGDVTFDKLYDLAQEDVLKMQINEFCACRAPAEALNMIFNIEETLEDKIEELGNKLGEAEAFLEKVDSISGKLNYVFDTLEALADFRDKFKDLRDMYTEFQNSVDSLNEAISAREEYKDGLDKVNSGEYTETPPPYTEEGYHQMCSAVEDCAKQVQTAIPPLISALEEFHESYKTFKDSFDTMKVSGIKEDMSGGVSENVQQMMSDMEECYTDSEEKFGEIESKMNNYGQSDVDESELALNTLSEQLNDVDGATLGEVSAVELSKWSDIENAEASAEQTITEAEQEVAKEDDNDDGLISKVTSILDSMKALADIDGLDYFFGGNTISDVTELTSVKNPYEDSDLALVEAQKAAAAEIAEYTNFNMNTLNPDDDASQYAELENAMASVQESGKTFREACGNFTAGDIRHIISSLKNITDTLIQFIADLTNLISVFIKVVMGNLLERILYQKFNPAMYSIGMFSNWTTDMEEDTRLNGSSFQDYEGSSDVFVRANAEYVLGGHKVEQLNKTQTFIEMLMMRLLCNLPAILTDKELMDLVKALCEIPVFGWIIAIFIVVVLIFCEAICDMVLLLKGDSVEIIKTERYLDLANVDQWGEKITDLINNGAGGGDDEGYVDGLSKWDYEEHLLFLLLIFVPGDKMYERCANLIQMQMRQSEENFQLEDMYTYLRVESKAAYTPLLPIPAVPGLNSGKLEINNIHYSGY